MIKREEIQETVRGYNENVNIGIFGSHSAVELGMSAKAFGFGAILYVQKGRGDLYTKYNRHLYDKIIELDNFKDILKPEHQEFMIKNNVVFFPNRSFSVYLKDKGAENEYGPIENDFKVPIYGNRFLLRTEDRKDEKGQYFLLQSAGIRTPIEFKKPEDIDRLAIVKVQQAGKELERAFFYVVSDKDYYEQVEQLKKAEVINDEVLAKSRIEEFVLGPRFNANFHAYGLKDEFGLMDFVGFSDRRQVNLGGILNLPAKDQLKLKVPVKNEEIGHMGVTMRESQKILAYEAAEKLLTSKTLLVEYPPGLIGPFGLQGAIQYSPKDNKTLEFVIFDLSPRTPGDPAIGPTSPEMRNLTLKHRQRDLGVFCYNDHTPDKVLAHRKDFGLVIESPLDLIMMEMHTAIRTGNLAELVT